MGIDTATGAAAPDELSKTRVKKVFSRIAQRYERFNAVSSFGDYRHWLNVMIDCIEITPESSVLDVAGGTGDVTFALARKKHPVRIMCTDLVPEMLEVAKAHYAQGASDGVSVDFEVVDAQDIPFADNQYDVVTVAYGVRNMPDRPRALAEMFRVLKPGGQFVCLEFSHSTLRVWDALYRFYSRHILPLWGKLITGQREDFDYLVASIEAFPGQEEYASLIEQAGFTDVAWKTCLFGSVAIHCALKPEEPSSQVSSQSSAQSSPCE